MRLNGHKLKLEVQTGYKEELFPRGHWQNSSLPGEVVQFLFSEVFKTRLDEALNSLGLLTLCWAGGAALSHPKNL